MRAKLHGTGSIRKGTCTAGARHHAAQDGVRSAPQLAYDFPGFTCISVNDEIVHGVPGPRVLQPGDTESVT